ncbi:GNAT family N-acetyltransferase [Streptacidiphilus fuscans]|uniref:GNAT family N-acetyltransferase n=1 Tax=Streptacidiphilus fuscans TaxID=2789292 RepID=A0A931FEH3_9ACTN|nr:GNAT family N-acetyltransferase [Streptacidiphilus fuscans]MBF9071762.1 GNAT family N-acetyltransferase [Streptacidiphilus fuscans]
MKESTPVHHLAPAQPSPPAPVFRARPGRRRWNRPPAVLALLPDQSLVRVRTAVPADLDAVQNLHRRCSLVTRHGRYHAAKSRLTDDDWTRLNHPVRAVCWLVTEPAHPGHVVAMANLIRHTADDTTADLAVMVEDPWQRRGLGSTLLRLALCHAERHQLRQVTATTPATARHLHTTLGAHGFHTTEHTDTDRTVTTMAVDLPRAAVPCGGAR